MVHCHSSQLAFRSLAASLFFAVIVPRAALAEPPPPAAEGPAPQSPSSQGERTSLQAVLAHAREHAPGLSVLDEEFGRVAARRRGTAPLLADNPRLAFGIGPRFGGASGTDFDFALGLEQPIGVSGERKRERETIAPLERRLRAERALYLWRLEQEIELAYRSLLHEEARLAVEDRALAFALDLARIAERRVAHGEATAIEQTVVRADALRAEQRQRAARAGVVAAQLVLAELAGYPLESPPRPLEESLPKPTLPPVESLLAAAEKHPDLARQDAVVAEEHAEVRLEDRRSWIKPTVGVELAREGSAGSPANYIVLGTLGLPLPAFERGQAERAERRVDEDVARAERERKRREYRARVQRAHADALAAEQQLALFTEGLLPQLAQGLSLIERAYAAGELDAIEVALVRERLLGAERDAVEARAEYERCWVVLQEAVGRPLGGSSSPAGGVR